ncbi:MAG TPA: glutamine-hydrolyzing carbamoyl-phosphate synthase small subunit [Sulfurovum sp.]|jgi:carbamoyl-phosphate synthase small subunit|nr:MAG: carbamoyl phosphate synthase small subunit [Sulfurovum sp. 35-42-20]OYZ26320.1 MAG: carbamoyl phosphate synthase small subunit [Sulfurovum sp. 16-42-52]OYZ48794.1 MAG: carbamoyl phosphate synthase small subunit [Sulfurovum sp. 24-42-9]OZA46502.1 MAG: carbamoyl phosphate synthase small subunit [Sulfurovum sp. 17-42-90]OZA59078.1 MAG: carbamoyl phosphate synthase small subunit [Sulfurovum sp. 39-42-12]HQR74267.1 glutamine-hydrolyzing carbamoyl-phosphate synthase small subunit [Sulfurovum
MTKVSLYFENGLMLEAKSFGAVGTAVGEIVFNTSLTGYQEIATDPSYAGQFVTFTMPEIGNVGCNAQDMESKGVHCKGIIVRSYQDRPSNFRSEESLAALLKRNNVLGITEIDTRFITKILREEGAMMMVASTELHEKDALKKVLESSPRIEEINYIEQVSTKEAYVHTQARYNTDTFCYDDPKTFKKIIALDFGIKRNILNELTHAGMEVTVVPNSMSAEAIIAKIDAKECDGVFLSNGPGDPLILKEEHEKIKKLIAHKVPLFGICLGHQLLSIAHGYDTYKLQFGHHGGNHPVVNVATNSVEITAQNHNYNVPQAITEVATVTHINLFDNTIEGLKYNDSPTISVQHHPEASPGPHESAYIFSEFAKML